MNENGTRGLRPYPVKPIRGTLGRGLLCAVAMGLLLFWLAAPGYASTYPNDPQTGVAWVNECPALDEPCLAITERLESLANISMDGNGLFDTFTVNAADHAATANSNAEIAQADAASIVLAVNESAGGGGGGAVSLTGDSQEALEDVRRLSGYTVGILFGFLFVVAFWRTFGKRI